MILLAGWERGFSERADRGHYLLWAELSRKEERITVSIHSTTTRPLIVFCLRVFSSLSTLADSSAAALLPNRAVRDARVIYCFLDYSFNSFSPKKIMPSVLSLCPFAPIPQAISSLCRSVPHCVYHDTIKINRRDRRVLHCRTRHESQKRTWFLHA